MSGTEPGLRVVMVVANDVTRDSRVLREAAVLAADGHRVTILGIRTARTTAPDVELRDGFVIRRLPFRATPPGWWVPPDLHARVRHRAARQYRIHRARTAELRRFARRRLAVTRMRILGLRLGRLPALPAGLIAFRSSRPMPLRRRSRRSTRRRPIGRLRSVARRFWHAPPAAYWRRAGLIIAASRVRLVGVARALASQPRRLVIGRIPRPRAPGFALPRIRFPGHVARSGIRAVRAWAGIAGLLVWGTAYLVADRLTGGAIGWQTGWRWRWMGWARYVAEHAPDADVWHGHDMTSLPAIVELKRRRGGAAIYDSHEIYLESGRHADQPRWAKAPLEALERRLVREVDAVVTVNRSVASVLEQRLGVRDVAVLYNCPARVRTPVRGSRLRRTLGVPASTPLLVYHGSLAPHRGVEQLLLALHEPQLRSAHLVFLGFGPMLETLRAESLDERHAGRVHVLDAVDPDELPAWLAGVDVAVAPIQPSTLNHRLSSPNKVFEAIAAGTPVAGSDFPEFRGVIRDAPSGSLGELFDPTRPADIARAVARILEAPPVERAALRRRCRAAAAGRWNWEVESQALVALYARIADDPVDAPIRIGREIEVA